MELTKEDLEVLKNPFDWQIKEVKVVLEKAFPLTKVINTANEFLFLRFNASDVEVNYDKLYREDFGSFNIHNLQDGTIIRHLEKHFKYPLLPTEEERTLFEIEFGVSYPIKACEGDL